MVILPNGDVAQDFYPLIAWEEVYAVQGRKFNPGNYTTRVYLFTDDSDERHYYGSFTISTEAILPKGIRPVCIAMASKSYPEYSFDYDIPDYPPPMIFSQGDWGGATGTKVTINWQTIGTYLPPKSTYAINVWCPPRPPG